MCRSELFDCFFWSENLISFFGRLLELLFLPLTAVGPVWALENEFLREVALFEEREEACCWRRVRELASILLACFVLTTEAVICETRRSRC